MNETQSNALCDIVGDLRNLVSKLISENTIEQEALDKFRDALQRLNNLQLALDKSFADTQTIKIVESFIKSVVSDESFNKSAVSDSEYSENGKIQEYNYDMTPVTFDDVFMAKRDFSSRNLFTEGWDTGYYFETDEYHIQEPLPSHNYIVLKANKPPRLIVPGDSKSVNSSSETDESEDSDDEFVNKYKDKIDWYNVCICKEISEKCMIDNEDSIHWKNVSIYQTLSPEFIDNHIDKLHIPAISYFQDLPDWLIEKHKDKWDWGLLSCKTYYNVNLRQKMRNEHIESVVRNRIIWDISENTWSEDVSGTAE